MTHQRVEEVSGYVNPRLLLQDMADRGGRNTVVFGESAQRMRRGSSGWRPSRRARAVSCTNGMYIRLGQLGETEGFTAIVTPAAFAVHVERVVALGPKEEVARPNAANAAAVAPMENTQLTRSDPVLQFPSHAMRQKHTPVLAATCIGSSVPIWVPCSSPYPTGTQLRSQHRAVAVNVRPEACDNARVHLGRLA